MTGTAAAAIGAYLMVGILVFTCATLHPEALKRFADAGRRPWGAALMALGMVVGVCLWPLSPLAEVLYRRIRRRRAEREVRNALARGARQDIARIAGEAASHCRMCAGIGRVRVHHCSQNGKLFQPDFPIPSGQGYDDPRPVETCPWCRGSGKREDEKIPEA